MKRDGQSVLLATNLTDSDEPGEDGQILPESISIGQIEELLAQMRFHEVPKRALFSVPFTLAPDFTIGVKGWVIPAGIKTHNLIAAPYQLWSYH